MSRIGIREGPSWLMSIAARLRDRGFASVLRRNQRWVAEARSTPPLYVMYASMAAAAEATPPSD